MARKGVKSGRTRQGCGYSCCRSRPGCRAERGAAAGQPQGSPGCSCAAAGLRRWCEGGATARARRPRARTHPSRPSGRSRGPTAAPSGRFRAEESTGRFRALWRSCSPRGALCRSSFLFWRPRSGTPVLVAKLWPCEAEHRRHRPRAIDQIYRPCTDRRHRRRGPSFIVQGKGCAFCVRQARDRMGSAAMLTCFTCIACNHQMASFPHAQSGGTHRVHFWRSWPQSP